MTTTIKHSLPSGPVHGWQKNLVLFGILAGGLAKLFGGLLHVQQIVHDLKRQPHRLSVTGQGFVLLVGSTGAQGAHAKTGPKQSPGLGSMNRLQQFRFRRLAFPLQIVDLAGDSDIQGGSTLAQLSMQRHFEPLLKGLFNSADVAYYLLVILFFIGFTIRRMDAIRLQH